MSALRLLDVPKDLPDPPSKLMSKNAKVESDLSAAGSYDGAVANEAARMAALEKFSPEIAREFARPDISASNGDIAPAEKAVSSVTPPLARAGDPVSAGEPVAGQRPFLKETQPAFLKEPPPPTLQGVQIIAGGSIPDFRGKTKRDVIQQSMASGVAVELFGDGLASNQDPLPGASMRPGVAVKVLFGR